MRAATYAAKISVTTSGENPNCAWYPRYNGVGRFVPVSRISSA